MTDCTSEIGASERAATCRPHDAVAMMIPIGQSGSRLLTTMLYEMKRRDVHKGLAALCLGGGNAVALAVER